MNPTWTQMPIHALGELLERGELRAEDLVAAVLAAIRERDPRIGAYLHVDEEDALAQARAADTARAAGRRGPLLGIPIAVKDLINIAGQPCTCASRILEGYRATYDATVVTRLRATGAILLGRTNMDEFAMGSSTENSAFQVTRNPWAPACVPGGSSGGSAAAVAAGEAVAALGSDTGGSIRQPAAFCGCVGLKPTYGRVSRFGLTAFASSLDQIGPITRCVRDAATVLHAMAGRDPRDATSADEPPPEPDTMFPGDLRGLTLGRPREMRGEGVDREVAAAVDTAAAQCRELGARIVDVTLPHAPYALSAYYLVATAEASANLARFDGIRYGLRVEGDDPIDLYGRTRAAGFGPEVKRRILLGTYALSSGYHDAYYLRAQKVRTLIRRDFDEAFARCDAIVGPATPTAAPRIGEQIEDPLTMYLNDMFTIPASLAGNCALSVPCGFTADGRPIGLQVIGPAMAEASILRVAEAYERAAPWRDRTPPWPPAAPEDPAP